MRTIVYKLYAAGTSDTNAAATLTMPRGGVITAILGRAQCIAVTASTVILGELSFVATRQNTSNDTRGSLMEIAAGLNLVTSGGALNVNHAALSGVAIPINAGDRLYLHLEATGTVAAGSEIAFFVYVSE